MKLDPDCIRDTLIRIEETENYKDIDGEIVSEPIWLSELCQALPQYKTEMLYYTVTILEEAGFLRVGEYWEHGDMDLCCISRLTYEGHEFLETIRPQSVWEKTVGVLKGVGSFGLEFMKGVAHDALVASASAAMTAILPH